MPNQNKRGDQIPNGAPRQESTSHVKGRARRTPCVVPLLVTLLCALALVVSGSGCSSGLPKFNNDAEEIRKMEEASKASVEKAIAQRAAEEQAAAEKAAAEKAAAEKAAAEKAAAEKAAAEKAAAEKAAAEKAEAERIAAEKAEAERIEAEHQRLREEAIANGEQVFEGTVFVGNGYETAELTGNLENLNKGFGSNIDKFWAEQEKSSFVILMLDSAQPVYITGYSGGDTTKNSAFIELGSNRYSSYGNTYTDNGYSNWANYGGERVCVAVSNCGIPMAIDVVIEPIAGQSRLLYVVE